MLVPGQHFENHCSKTWKKRESHQHCVGTPRSLSVGSLEQSQSGDGLMCSKHINVLAVIGFLETLGDMLHFVQTKFYLNLKEQDNFT